MEEELRDLANKKEAKLAKAEENKVGPLQLLKEPKKLTLDEAKPKTEAGEKNKVELLQLPKQPKRGQSWTRPSMTQLPTLTPPAATPHNRGQGGQTPRVPYPPPPTIQGLRSLPSTLPATLPRPC